MTGFPHGPFYFHAKVNFALSTFSTDLVRHVKDLQMPPNSSFYDGSPYPFGMDPVSAGIAD